MFKPENSEKSFPNRKEINADGTLVIHTRPARKGAGKPPTTWYARGWFGEPVFYKGKPCTGWTDLGTLKTKNEAEAVEKARKLYRELTRNQELGRKHTGDTLTDLITKWVADVERREAEGDTTLALNASGFARRLNERISTYLSTVKPEVNSLGRFNKPEIQNYFAWRIRQPTYRGKRNGGEPEIISDTSTARAIDTERTWLWHFFSWCVRQNFLGQNEVPDMPEMPEGYYEGKSDISRRPDLPLEDWNRLKVALDDLCNPENLPLKNRERSLYYMELTRDFLHMMAYTGCRPHELYYLQWKDIKQALPKPGDNTGDKGSVALQINDPISRYNKFTRKQLKGKTKARICGGLENAYGILTKRRERLAEKWGVDTSDGEYIFCHPPRPVCLPIGIPQNWVKSRVNSIDKAFKKAGIRLEDDTELDGLGFMEKVEYSMRHFYITQARDNGVDMEWVAEQTGTSRAMIKLYYDHTSDVDRAIRMGELNFIQ